MRIKNIAKLIVSLVVCQLAGVVGSLFISPSIYTWYVYLERPSFTPPNWFFSPVWIILFVFMGISLYLLWKDSLQERSVRVALVWFGGHIFFGLKAPFLAFIEILLLWVAILITLVKALKVSKTASFLLIPYFSWVSFAVVLNFYIWALNI